MKVGMGLISKVCLWAVVVVFLASGPAVSTDLSPVEMRIISLVKEFYPQGDDLYVKFLSMPASLKEGMRIRNISFARVPEATGDGICSVDVEEKNGRDRTVQVAFRVLFKKKLFALKDDLKKGETLTPEVLSSRDVFLSGNTASYPKSAEDIAGRRLKKDLPAGTLVTVQVLEETVHIQRGEIVTIVAGSKRLVVQAKGRTLDRGKIGDTIRVKNIASGKEVTGKLTGGDTVAVSF